MFLGLVLKEQKVEIDEATLSEIAHITGGKYYRATSNESLMSVYNEIDSLEKSKLKAIKFIITMNISEFSLALCCFFDD